MDTVVLEAGATLGPHCVALPAARIGAGATVGPASLVMRGDEVPAIDPLARQPDRAVESRPQEGAQGCLGPWRPGHRGVKAPLRKRRRRK